jgi:protein-disulfide isomerase
VAKPMKPLRTAPDRRAIAIGIVALVLLAVVGVVTLNRGSGAIAPVAISTDPVELQRARGVAVGPEDAPVQLFEFADYQCPACGQFATFAHPLIKERLVDEGVVRLVRYDFPLPNHQHAFLAARAARCADDQGRYWEYHDVLYGRQPTWSQQRDPSSEFVDYAQLVGVDRREFQQCLRSDRHAEEVTRNLRLGESLGVNSTPTLMLNGERLMVRDYRELEERVLAAAGRAPSAPNDAAAARDPS